MALTGEIISTHENYIQLEGGDFFDMGDGLRVNWGALQISSYNLELSMNYCSHQCPYCFSNLNKPERKFDPKQVMNLLSNLKKSKTLEAQFLREGFPVVASNHVDPFADSNWRFFLPIAEAFTEMGIPIALQTRGGKGIDEFLEFSPKTGWYITLNYWDDETRKKVEPSATSIPHRWELIEKLRSLGHEVTIGINPAIPAHLPPSHAEKIIEKAISLDVDGILIEVLHFSRKQLKQMKPQWKRQLGADTLRLHRPAKQQPKPLFDYFLKLRSIAHELGAPYWSGMQGNYSGFGDRTYKLYKTWPTLQSWVNHAHKQGWDSSKVITFSEYWDFFKPHFPEGKHNIGNFICTIANEIYRTYPGKWTNWITYEDLYKTIWSNPLMRTCPVNSPPFAYHCDNQGDMILDDDGLPVMGFWPEYQEFTQELV